ncbi:MAG: hypothetical protein ACI9K2_001282 [Myxococcota bacterium]|jgi:hypothetical protein
MLEQAWQTTEFGRPHIAVDGMNGRVHVVFVELDDEDPRSALESSVRWMSADMDSLCLPPEEE